MERSLLHLAVELANYNGARGARRRAVMSDITVRKQNGGENLGTVLRRDFEPFRLMREMLGWDPFREIAPLAPAGVSAFSPAFEVKETKDSFVFKADLPGVKESDLEVSLAGNRLTLAGKRESEKEEKDDTYYMYERSYGSFTRTFTLPDKVDTSHVKAELKGGELTVVVPKTAAAVPMKVPIVAGEKTKS
jgi:HSP20 family protein